MAGFVSTVIVYIICLSVLSFNHQLANLIRKIKNRA